MNHDAVLQYKGYWARIEYSAEDRLLYGKIEGIADLISFESESAGEIESAFHDAVDDYLAFCAEQGKAPDKPYKGSFNVRIPPELHRRAAREASRRGLSLNQYVEEALTAMVGPGDPPGYLRRRAR